MKYMRPLIIAICAIALSSCATTEESANQSYIDPELNNYSQYAAAAIASFANDEANGKYNSFELVPSNSAALDDLIKRRITNANNLNEPSAKLIYSVKSIGDQVLIEIHLANINATRLFTTKDGAILIPASPLTKRIEP